MERSRLICLDTDFLIHGLVAGSPEAAQIVGWYQSGEPMIAPMPAWFEFLCGPVTAVQVATIRAFLKTIVSFDEPQATEAARLFDAVSRKRGLRVDAMMAGTATASGARLATNNHDDFGLFVPHGLELI